LPSIGAPDDILANRSQGEKRYRPQRLLLFGQQLDQSPKHRRILLYASSLELDRLR
jgi:hypothetical protein